MGHGHNAILCNPNRFIFGHNKNFLVLGGPTEQLSNCPWVQGKSNKPLPGCGCVCVGGGGGGQKVIP